MVLDDRGSLKSVGTRVYFLGSYSGKAAEGKDYTQMQFRLLFTKSVSALHYAVLLVGYHSLLSLG
jgi:hypothetical protein